MSAYAAHGVVCRQEGRSFVNDKGLSSQRLASCTRTFVSRTPGALQVLDCIEAEVALRQQVEQVPTPLGEAQLQSFQPSKSQVPTSGVLNE
jgi:hypothetical protein